MQLLKHFHELSLHPKNAQEIKGLILQLAVQGKLTANWRVNNPNIESVTTLLKKIGKEKTRLISEKKVKQEPRTSSANKNDLPFLLPNSWKWCKLVEISTINGGFAFKSTNYIEKGARVIRISDFDEAGFKNHKIVRHNYTDDLAPFVLEDKNILLAMTGGTVGKSLFVDSAKEIMVVNQRVATIKIFKPIHEAYINCVIPTKLVQDVIEEAKNSTNDNISMADIKGFNIPLPPLEEQKAIVDTVNALFAEVEQLETLTKDRIRLKEDFATSVLRQLTKSKSETINGEWAFLKEHFHSFFTEKANIKKLRESILQLAVQGKLTTSWRKEHPDREDAGVLLKRIQDEKAQLIKEGKIKKEKPLPPIAKEDIPYELPEGWVWSNMLDISLKVTDGEHATPKRTNDGYKLLSARNVTNEGIRLHKVDYVGKDEFLRIRKRCDPQKGDVLISCSGSVGRVCLVDKDEEYCMVRSAALVKHHHDYLMGEYLVHALRSSVVQEQIVEKSRSTAQSNLFLGKIKELIFPMPSLVEQKAIVEKVNALMALCDSLERGIEQSNTQIEQWMKSALREVFEGEKEEIEQVAMAAETDEKYKKRPESK
jgi:type I restriction enzyme S subunit